MRRIVKERKGLLIHAYDQDGRGVKSQRSCKGLRVYMEQDKGHDTIEADRRCGFNKPDRRDYSETIEIIKDFNLKNIRLLTNNSHRIESLNVAGINTTREHIEAVKVDKYNIAQLYMKKKVLGHLFDAFDL